VNAPQEDPNVSMFSMHRYLAVYVFAFGMVGLAGLIVIFFWYLAHPLRGGARRQSSRTALQKQPGALAPDAGSGAVADSSVAEPPVISRWRYHLSALWRSLLGAVRRRHRGGVA
jgi:hypothetical protein